MPHVCRGCVFAIDSHLASSLGFHKPILRGFYCQSSKKNKNCKSETRKMSSLKEAHQFTRGPFCHTLDWTERWHAAGFFSTSPSVRSGCSGPPRIKNPLNRARLRAYTVCSVADRNAGQAVVRLSGYSEFCGGGWVESKHRQGLYWLGDAWLSSRGWERASACCSWLWGWAKLQHRLIY